MTRQTGLHPRNQNIAPSSCWCVPACGNPRIPRRGANDVQTRRVPTRECPGDCPPRNAPPRDSHCARLHRPPSGGSSRTCARTGSAPNRASRARATSPRWRPAPAPCPGDALPNQDWRPAPDDRIRQHTREWSWRSLACGAGPVPGTQQMVHVELQFPCVAVLAIPLEGHRQQGPGGGSTVRDVAIGALHGERHAPKRSRHGRHMDRMIQTQRPQIALRRAAKLGMATGREGRDIPDLGAGERARRFAHGRQYN